MRERHLSRDDVGGAGHRIDIADGADQPVLVGPAEFLDRDDAFGGTRQRIAPQHHRHRAGMAGHAGEASPRAASRPQIAVTTPTGEIQPLQHRALLDVQFDIGQQFAARPRGRADMVGIEPELRQRLAHREAGAVACAEHALVERSRDGAAAEQRRCKAHALLVGKADHLDRERQPRAAPVQIGDAGRSR